VFGLVKALLSLYIYSVAVLRAAGGNYEDNNTGICRDGFNYKIYYSLVLLSVNIYHRLREGPAGCPAAGIKIILLI